jgi:hypothetical protein
MSDESVQFDGVFHSGGVKDIALVGSLAAVEAAS